MQNSFSLEQPAAQFTSRLKWLSLALIVQGAAALIYLASLPSGEKGLSTPRLAVLGLLLLAELLLAAGSASLFVLPKKLQKILAAVAGAVERLRFETLLVSGFITVSGVYLLVRWQFLPATYEYQISLPRLIPVMLLVTLLSAEIFYLALPERRVDWRKQSLIGWFRGLVEKPTRLPRVLCLIVVLLVAASFAGQVVRYFFPAYYIFVDFVVTEFFMDYETNLPAFFSALLLLFVSLTMGIMGYVKTKTVQPFRFHWMFLSLLFVILAADELYSLHEMLSEPVQAQIYAVGLLYWPWFLPILPVLVILFFVYLRFFRDLPRKTLVLFMLSTFIYLGAAIAMEAVSAAFADEYGMGNFTYTLLANAEEVAEMGGLILLIYTLFEYSRKI